MELNRREFIGTTAGAAVGVTLSERSAGQPQASSVDELFDRTIVVDMLSDFTREGVSANWDPATFDAIRESGYTCVQTTLLSGIPARQNPVGPWLEGNFDMSLASLAKWQESFKKYPDRIIQCTSVADIERAKRERKLAIILGFQNAPFKDDVGSVGKMYEAGCRCVQLTYNSRNNLGDGCTERTQSGLSDFGIACVERMDELGMIVDLSHCGDATSSDGMAFSKHPCFTHTVCQALHYHPRGKSDSLLRAMSNKGGITGICMVGYFLTAAAQATLEDYINHLDHAVKISGIDHVAMSTDTPVRGRIATTDRDAFMKSRTTEYKPNYNPRWAWAPELDKADRYRTIAHALSRKGYKSANIDKLLGANWVRFLREVFKG